MKPNFGVIFGRMPARSLNRLVGWGEHFMVDQAQLDAQHEAIFNMAMDLDEASQAKGNPERLEELTGKLGKLLEIHFGYEERQLAEAGYPKSAEHALEHRVMLEQLRMIRARLHTSPGGTPHIAARSMVHDFVLGLTVGHITHSDMDYCAFTRKPREVEPGERPAA